MHTCTDIATIIGNLLPLATAAINLATAIQTRPRHGDNQQSKRNDNSKPGKPF